MSNINDGGSAFPLKEPLTSDSEGMTLRDYFAAKAMAAFTTSPWTANDLGISRPCDGETLFEACARNAYLMADAMLAQRNKRVH